ncbi:hypothetical protein D3C87_786820 [compost metagenome]
MAVITTVPALAYFGMVTLPSASTTARSVLLLIYVVPSVLCVTSFVFPSPMVAVTVNCLVSSGAKVTVPGVTAIPFISVAGSFPTVNTAVVWEIPFLTEMVTVPKVALGGIVIRPSASTIARAMLLLVYTVFSLLLVISFRVSSPIIAVTVNCCVSPNLRVTFAGLTSIDFISFGALFKIVNTTVLWNVLFLTEMVAVPAPAYFGIVISPSAFTTARSVLLLV